jgi:hypothetical protein
MYSQTVIPHQQKEISGTNVAVLQNLRPLNATVPLWVMWTEAAGCPPVIV